MRHLHSSPSTIVASMPAGHSPLWWIHKRAHVRVNSCTSARWKRCLFVSVATLTQDSAFALIPQNVTVNCDWAVHGANGNKYFTNVPVYMQPLHPPPSNYSITPLRMSEGRYVYMLYKHLSGVFLLLNRNVGKSGALNLYSSIHPSIFSNLPWSEKAPFGTRPNREHVNMKAVDTIRCHILKNSEVNLLSVHLQVTSISSVWSQSFLLQHKHTNTHLNAQDIQCCVNTGRYSILKIRNTICEADSQLTSIVFEAGNYKQIKHFL